MSYQLIPYDFDTQLTEIQNKIKAKSEWKNVSIDDTIFQMILYILGYKEEFIMSAINNEFLNVYPHQAAGEEGIRNFANQIQMSVNNYTSAFGTVTFYLDSVYSKDIVIPYGTEIATADGTVIFTTQESVVLQAGTLEVDAEVIQGQFTTVNNTSDGSENQTYYIFDTVEKNNTTIYVHDADADPTDSDEYTIVNNFYESEDDDKHCIIRITNDGIYVLFSDGVYGMKPASGKNVRVTYLSSLGESGNILSSGLVTKVISPITDIDGATVTVKVTNDDEIKGGQDKDSATDIKEAITRFFITNPYITRKIDYRNYLLEHPLVLDANVFAGWELYPSDNTKWTTIYCYVVPRHTTQLTDGNKETLFAYLKDKDTFFSYIEFPEVSYVSVYALINILFKEDIVTASQLDLTRTEINTIVTDYFDLETALSEYGTVFRNIYLSELSTDLSVIEELRKFNIYLQSVEEVVTVAEGDLSYTDILSFQSLKEEETYLYLGDGINPDLDEQVGTFDADWSIILNDNSGDGGLNWITGGPGGSPKISATITEETSTLDITIIDTTLTNSSESDNVIGKIFYVRSNAYNDDDLTTTNKNFCFQYYDHDTQVES